MNHQSGSSRRQAISQYDTWQREDEQKEKKDGLTDITPESREMLVQHLPTEFPTWPTSLPGPLASLPVPGSTPINRLRSEQMAEVNYNQETGKAGTDNPLRYWPDESQRERVSFDQIVSGQEKMVERAHRPSETAYQELLDIQHGASLPTSQTKTYEDVLSSTMFPLTFNTFNTALRATSMQYLLEGRRPLTVFAPTDIAFSLLHYGTIYDLLKHLTALEQLIAYHLVPLKLTVANLRYLASTPPLQGDAIVGEELPEVVLPTFSRHVLTASFSRELLIDNVRVVQADIEANNIVIHLVEKVLWPPDLKQTDIIPEIHSTDGGSAAS